MFAGEELRRLEETKRLLAAQADIHRNLIRRELTEWSARLSWLRAGKAVAGNFRLYLLAAAALAGLGATAVKWRTILRWAPRLFAIWRVTRGLFTA